MLHEAIPPPVAALLRDIHHWPLPLHTYLAGGTDVALYPYPLIKSMIANDAYDIYLASPEDIAAMKRVRLNQKEWGRVEDFFKRLVLG